MHASPETPDCRLKDDFSGLIYYIADTSSRRDDEYCLATG